MCVVLPFRVLSIRHPCHDLPQAVGHDGTRDERPHGNEWSDPHRGSHGSGHAIRCDDQGVYRGSSDRPDTATDSARPAGAEPQPDRPDDLHHARDHHGGRHEDVHHGNSCRRRSVINRSVINRPIINRKVLIQPVLIQPVFIQPVVIQPVSSQPVGNYPVLDQQVIWRSVIRRAVVEQPVTGRAVRRSRSVECFQGRV
jgi:hypothetical protein